jgi:hypothetical protein
MTFQLVNTAVVIWICIRGFRMCDFFYSIYGSKSYVQISVFKKTRDHSCFSTCISEGGKFFCNSFLVILFFNWVML